MKLITKDIKNVDRFLPPRSSEKATFYSPKSSLEKIVELECCLIAELPRTWNARSRGAPCPRKKRIQTIERKMLGCHVTFVTSVRRLN